MPIAPANASLPWYVHVLLFLLSALTDANTVSDKAPMQTDVNVDGHDVIALPTPAPAVVLKATSLILQPKVCRSLLEFIAYLIIHFVERHALAFISAFLPHR